MIRATLNQIGNAVNAYTHNNLAINGVSIDSRNIASGNLFIAIKGPNFDGHEYIHQAIEKGAVAIIAEHEVATKGVPVLVVKDSRIALGLLAKCWREMNNWLVVAITGSNGKTSVKEMTHCVLAKKYQTQATKGNLNNDFGVPLTILSTSQHTEALVVEMGANHLGEIAYLTDIAQPDIVLVNNIGTAHIEGFGSQDAIAQAKSEIYQGLKTNGTVIFNADDSYANYLKQQFTQSYIDFSIKKSATLQAKNIQKHQFDCCYLTSQITVQLAVWGLHNVSNALAAIAIGLAAGLDTALAIKGLANYSGVAGRLQIKKGVNQSTLIDDSYNANVDSMKAGIDYLVGLNGRAWLFVGNMAELGSEAKKMHKEVAHYAKQQGVEHLFVVGEMGKIMCQTFGNNCDFAQDGSKLSKQISKKIKADVNLLIKGSRSAGMEKYVAELGESSC